MKRLDAKVTEAARALVKDFLSSYEANSVIGLGYGQFKTYTAAGEHRGETVARWRFVAITRAQADDIEKTSEALGGTEGLYNVDGITMWLFEPADVERLRGKILDAERGKLFIR